MSANSLARYGFAAAFPLFTIQSERKQSNMIDEESAANC